MQPNRNPWPAGRGQGKAALEADADKGKLSGVRRTRGVPTQKKRPEINGSYYFANTKDDIYVMKVINDVYCKDVNSVARPNATNSNLGTGRRAPLIHALQEGLSRGALGEALTGAPTGGGVLRWELERAPITTFTLQGQMPDWAFGSSNCCVRT